MKEELAPELGNDDGAPEKQPVDTVGELWRNDHLDSCWTPVVTIDPV